jgi:hypothetical protein
MAELGNLIAGIVLRLERLSTVKIRAGSLFCTSDAPVEATGAALRTRPARFPPPSTGRPYPAQDVHRPPAIPACAKPAFGCKVEIDSSQARNVDRD